MSEDVEKTEDNSIGKLIEQEGQDSLAAHLAFLAETNEAKTSIERLIAMIPESGDAKTHLKKAHEEIETAREKWQEREGKE